MPPGTQFQRLLHISGPWKVSLKGFSDINLFIDAIQKGDYQLAITEVNAPVFEPSFIMQLYENKSDTINRANWENDRYKEIMREAKHSLGDI